MMATHGQNQFILVFGIYFSFLFFLTLFVLNSCIKPNEEFYTEPLANPFNQSLNDTILPCFGPGDSLFNEYIISNFNYPESAIRDKVEGRILVKFTVNSDSTISNVSILHGLQDDCDEEAMNTISNIPYCIPAMVNNVPINLDVVFPIMLKLE